MTKNDTLARETEQSELDDERVLSRDINQNETVYLKGGVYPEYYHTERDCRGLQAANTINQKRKGDIDDDLAHCTICARSWEQPGSQDNSYYEALLQS